MSQRTSRWSVVCVLFACACILLGFACATGGGNGNGTDDASVPIDAPMTKLDGSTTTTPDAPKDASMPPPPQDAMMPPPPQDAPSGPICTANSQCTVTGQCCLMINGVGFCVPGTIILDVCFPIT
jgi:hypothetical protein